MTNEKLETKFKKANIFEKREIMSLLLMKDIHPTVLADLVKLCTAAEY